MSEFPERDEIMNMLVHDVRGPLGSIMTALTLVQEMMDDPQQREDTQLMHQILDVSLESAMGLMKLINSYIEITYRPNSAANLPLIRSEVSLNELVESAESAVKTALEAAHITLETDIPDDLPHVDADGEKIRRVLVNLLENAVHFTPADGKIRVSVEGLADEGKVIVRVMDSGLGIAPEEREKVFEKFWRSRETGPIRRHIGFGLGLTFCKLVLESHGERIWIEDDCGLPGTCVAFTLPYVARM